MADYSIISLSGYYYKPTAMNPYYYLFYKLTRFLNKKGKNEWGVIYAVSLFPGIILSIGYAKALKLTPKMFDGFYIYPLILLLAIIFIFNSIMFLNKKRVSRIIKHYENETEAQRKLGNAIIILLVLITLALIIISPTL